MSTLDKVDWAKVTKSVRRRLGTHITEKEVQSIAEKAVSEAQTEAIVEHRSLAQVMKSMRSSGIRLQEQPSGRFLSAERDGFGRVNKSGEEDNQTYRDMHGRKRSRA